MPPKPAAIEWPTLMVFAATYGIWVLGTLIWPTSAVLSLVLVTLSIAQFSSLQHEVLHGHPFGNQAMNEALVFAGLTVFVPYLRFKDTHLQHHYDPKLTDPYDDPESNYMDPAVWHGLSWGSQRILRANNTLLGRILLGPAISTWFFWKADFGAILGGNRRVALAWALHVVGVAMVLVWLIAYGAMPIWAYVLAAYAGYGILKIRTFLEHRAHEAYRARSVVVEDRGPLALLFLNNNLHCVHHMHPAVAWYKLPALYAAKADHYRRRNDAYVFKNYAEIFLKFLFRAKDPVPHPIWPINRKDAVDDAA